MNDNRILASHAIVISKNHYTKHIFFYIFICRGFVKKPYIKKPLNKKIRIAILAVELFRGLYQLIFTCSKSTVKNNRKRSEICLKLAIKTPERRP